MPTSSENLRRRRSLAGVLLLCCWSPVVLADGIGSATMETGGGSEVLELPILLAVTALALLAAHGWRGAPTARGVLRIAWGVGLMSLSQLHLVAEQLFGIHLVQQLFGPRLSSILLLDMRLAGWVLIGLGCYSLYQQRPTAPVPVSPGPTLRVTDAVEDTAESSAAMRRLPGEPSLVN